ncbi:MAG: GxxExxY protein [Aquabacterium sp.]|nr:GxxExxY protein [Aquabacterium sp.]
MNEISGAIVDAAYKVHTTLGPGLLESVYEAAMEYELRKRGLRVVRQVPIPVVYEEVRLEEGFRADLIVEDKVIVELKSVEAVYPVHKKQLLTYLRLADKRLGLLINFGASLIKDGISRIANGYKTLPLCASAPLREPSNPVTYTAPQFAWQTLVREPPISCRNCASHTNNSG